MTEFAIRLPCTILPSATMDFSSVVPEIFVGGNTRGLVKILCPLLNKLNLGISDVRSMFASKKESIFPMSVQYPS